MQSNIAMSLDRADKILADLNLEYQKALGAKVVSDCAINYTHEVAERLRSVLDRIARAYFERHVAPTLSDDEKEKALVYFPITESEQSFRSVLGRWRSKTLSTDHLDLQKYLESLQPYANQDNLWLKTLNSLALQSKHIDLVPQIRVEERRITVSSPQGGFVSYGSGVTFGSGVSIMGAPVDPRTQRIGSNTGLTETIEKWVSFLIEGYNVNAASFCAESCKKVREIAEIMSARFAI